MAREEAAGTLADRVGASYGYTELAVWVGQRRRGGVSQGVEWPADGPGQNRPSPARASLGEDAG